MLKPLPLRETEANDRTAGGSAGATGSGLDDRGSGVSEQRRRELADFLRTRREKLKPEQVGIAQVSRRRTPGLRREEVAELAGVGTTWYTWLEQARDIQPSSEVLRRLGQALRMTPAEIRHMFALAGKAAPSVDSGVIKEELSESLQRFVHRTLKSPAIVLGARWDVLTINDEFNQRFPVLATLPPEHRNWLYYIFCDPAPRKDIESWEGNARRLLAEFRSSVSDFLDHPWVLELIELLQKESTEFAQWWREHDVRNNTPILVHLNNAVTGKLEPFERTILLASENPKFKILLMTPAEA